MKVRLAKPEDFVSLMDLCRLLYKENGATKVNWKIVEDVVIKGIKGEMSTLGVVGDIGNVEGMMYLRFSTVWYSDEIILEELYNFVHPEHRRSNNAKLLAGFAKEASDRLGIPLIIGIISNKRTEGKIRLYQRVFGKASGAYFLYNARTGREDE